MSGAEIHLFIIWSQALHAADAILSDIDSTFHTLDVVDVVWTPELFSRNVARFYTTQLPPGSYKEKECGTGPFRVVIVRDLMPRYERRLTSKGSATVNARIFDARARYRSWTGGGHKIHSSVTQREAYRDLRLLFDIDADIYTQPRPSPPERFRHVEADLIGAAGWESVQQLMRALTAVTPAVLLFGFDAIDSDLEAASPVTVLVDHRWDAVMIANGRPRAPLYCRITYKVDVAGRDLWFDLRQAGEGYFDPRWERAMLDGRVEVNGLPMPPLEDRRHVLLYEDLVRPSRRRIDGRVDSAKSLLDVYFARTGYKRVNLRGPGVPVEGERMPLKWKIGAVGRWITRASKSVQRRINERFCRADGASPRNATPAVQDRQG